MNLPIEFAYLMAGVITLLCLIVAGIGTLLFRLKKTVERLEYVVEDIDEDPMKGKWNKKDLA